MGRNQKIAMVALTLVLSACAQEDSNVSVSISSTPFPLIPAEASSCLAKKSASSTSSPERDISASYFRIPAITFTRKSYATSELIISKIKISIPVPGASGPVECEVGGDSLAALHTDWYASTEKDALIPAGSASFVTDCPLYCGGIEVPDSAFGTGMMDVYGYERQSNGSESRVKVSTTISIENQ